LGVRVLAVYFVHSNASLHSGKHDVTTDLHADCRPYEWETALSFAYKLKKMERKKERAHWEDKDFGGWIILKVDLR
jgi:hypothetical protein